MTNQQTPKRIWITGTSKCGAWNVKPNPNPSLHEHEKAYAHHDLLEAAEKQRDELAAEVAGLKAELDIGKAFHDLAVKERDLERIRVDRLTSERDQALASVGTVIEKAAELTGAGFHPRDIRALDPDATAALNEMLADAWNEGKLAGKYDDNPYRKESK